MPVMARICFLCLTLSFTLCRLDGCVLTALDTAPADVALRACKIVAAAPAFPHFAQPSKSMQIALSAAFDESRDKCLDHGAAVAHDKQQSSGHAQKRARQSSPQRWQDSDSEHEQV